LIDVGYTRDAHHQETPHPRAADADEDLMASGVINAAKSPYIRPIDSPNAYTRLFSVPAVSLPTSSFANEFQ